MPTEKLKELLKELDKIRIMEKIKNTKDIGAIVDILKFLIDKFSVAKGERGAQGIKGDKGETGEQGTKGDKGNKGDKGDKGDTTIVEKVIETIIEKQPIITNEIKEVAVADTPEIIKQKLESLDDPEKLPIQAIKNLEEELRKLKKRIDDKVVYVGGGSSGGGRIVKSYDLSSQLNGVLKTFSLPAFYRVITVQSSSFPVAFRETTDYTTDGTLMQITFTSQIDSTTTLNTGQTIIVIFSE